MKKKKILLVIITPIFIYILWLSYLLLSFKTYRTTSTTPTLEIEGVYHIHSDCSDGKKNPDTIAKIAALSSLDFIILTDHGNPNYKCLESEGWKEGILVLAGSELQVKGGHLVALAFSTPSSQFSWYAEEAAQQIANLGGFSVIAHPYSLKVPWSWGESSNYQGMEIINGDSLVRKNFLSSLPYFPALLVKPEFALLKMIDYPHQNLKKWDELNNNYTIYGYFATEAHFLYRPIFSLLRLHLLLKNPLSSDFERAKHQVYNVLRNGKFYNAIDAAAAARGFKFWAQKGDKTDLMGKTLFLDAPITLHTIAPFPFDVETYLIHNGKTVFNSREKRISFNAVHTGTYRVEIYLRERTPLGKNIPWIISNPIFLGEVKK